MEDSRVEEVKLNLNQLNSKEDLQKLLKQKLNFPEFYGENWDAFWDTITGLVELPKRIVLENWLAFENKLPEEAKTLIAMLKDYNKEYPMIEVDIVIEGV